MDRRPSPLLCIELRTGAVFPCDSENVRDATREFQRLTGTLEQPALTIVDVASAQKTFDEFEPTKGRTEFSLTEVAALGGVRYLTGHEWLSGGLIRATVGGQRGSGKGDKVALKFNRHDALVASIVGRLVAQRIPRKTIVQATALLYGDGQQSKRKSPKSAKAVPA